MQGLIVFGDAATGAQGVADTLNTSLTADAFWNALAPFMPVVVTTTLVALGFYLIRKIIKKFSKGKSI